MTTTDRINPPADVVACGASPDAMLCPDCIDAYRNGIEPGGTACEELEYLRGQIRAECISMSEIAELQGCLADHIEPGDVELAEWAGIPEDEFMRRVAR